MKREGSLRSSYVSIFNYDFYDIACKRKENAILWYKLCADNHNLEILHQGEFDVTPQTFPVIIKNYDRTQLYFELNEAGFGAVSLYHTLIEPLRTGAYDDALWLSKHIMNMPVHQDIEAGQIEAMYKKITELFGV